MFVSNSEAGAHCHMALRNCTYRVSSFFEDDDGGQWGGYSHAEQQRHHYEWEENNKRAERDQRRRQKVGTFPPSCRSKTPLGVGMALSFAGPLISNAYQLQHLLSVSERLLLASAQAFVHTNECHKLFSVCWLLSNLKSAADLA